MLLPGDKGPSWCATAKMLSEIQKALSISRVIVRWGREGCLSRPLWIWSIWDLEDKSAVVKSQVWLKPKNSTKLLDIGWKSNCTIWVAALCQLISRPLMLSSSVQSRSHWAADLSGLYVMLACISKATNKTMWANYNCTCHSYIQTSKANII